MIDPILAIDKIKNYLKTEIDSGRLNGEYQENTKTISFYVYKTPGTTEPLLTLRITDHRPYLQKYIRSNAPRPSVEPNTNMSIEFYIPKKDSNGKTLQNRFINKVISPSSIPIVQPFTVSSFNYDSRKLDNGDEDIILKAIMDWIRNSKGERPYSDPFEKTPKEANVITKTANVVIKMVQMNISNGDYGADYVSESKNQKYANIKTENRNRNVVRLTETELKQIIAESVRMVLNESFDDALRRVKNGEDPNRVFDYCDDFQEGYAAVELNRKMNWIDTEGNLLSPNQWFDLCGSFSEGYAAIKINRIMNWVDKEGKLLFPNLAFESCSDFADGIALVNTHNMTYRYFIDKEGNLYDCDTRKPLGNVKGSLWNVKGVRAYEWKNCYSFSYQDGVQRKKSEKCYSVFYQNGNKAGNKANNHPLSKRDAFEIAMELEAIGHEVIVARRQGHGWVIIYETK